MAIDPLIGTPYAAVRFMARGASGEVWQARHRTLGKKVAVKLLHGWHVEDLRQTDRLRLEAQALGRLRSPHLVAAHDLGATREGRPYFVMDYLEGRTLDRELEVRGSMPVWEACRVALQLLEALGCVHQAGLVHRDVKPGNLFYCAGALRQLKLLDLGIAKLRSDTTGARELGVAPLAVPTESDFPIGTPRYLAPEQIDGRVVDARCDLYAAGLVLYKLLAGRGPFDHREGIAELFVAQVSEEPLPPSTYAPTAIAAELDAVVMKAIAKRRANRFQCAGSFAEALRGVCPHASHIEEAPTLRVAPSAVPTVQQGRRRGDPSAQSTRSEVAHSLAAASDGTERIDTIEPTLVELDLSGAEDADSARSGNLRAAEAVAGARAATMPCVYDVAETEAMPQLDPLGASEEARGAPRWAVAPRSGRCGRRRDRGSDRVAGTEDRAGGVARTLTMPALAVGHAAPALPLTRRVVGARCATTPGRNRTWDKGRKGVVRVVALAGAVAAAVAAAVLGSLAR